MLLTMSSKELIKSINELPLWLRQYIHDIEAKYDPSGDIRTIADLREQVRCLSALLAQYLEN